MARLLYAIGSRSNELDVVLAAGSGTYLRVWFKSSLNAGLELLQTATAPTLDEGDEDDPEAADAGGSGG